MIVEFGNHSAYRADDDQPAVTSIFIPEADKHGLGGYSHDVDSALSIAEFQRHRQESMDHRGGVTRLPGHEALLAIANAWPAHGAENPDWVSVTGGDKKAAKHLEAMLKKLYSCKRSKPGNVEDLYHTQFGPPGEGGPKLPDIKALFTNDGRIQQARNYGGGQTGFTSVATASGATSLTCGTASWAVNQWVGYRVYAVLAGGTLVWGNITANSATVLTVDRWYAVATPGGGAGATPSATGGFIIADGGMTSAWFVGLSTSNTPPVATDGALPAEYVVAGGGYARKIAPFSLTSGTSPMTFTLTPVFTGLGADTYPSTFYAVGVFTSMVPGAPGTMKFETLLSGSATVQAIGDQFSTTSTISGS